MECENLLNESVWGRRNYNSANHWEKLNLNNFKITKPTIICLGGNGTITERAANGNVEIVEGMLKSIWGQSDITKDIDLISVGYGRHCKNKKQLEKRTNGDLSLSEKEEFVENVLISMCFDKNGKMLDTKSICKNISQITFVSHCAGAQILNDIIELFFIKMTERNVDADTISKITEFFQHVSYAPINGLRQNASTTLFYSARDLSYAGTIISGDIERELDLSVNDVKGISLLESNKKTLFGDRKCIGVISKCLQNRNHSKEILDEHSYSILRKLQTGETMPYDGRVSPNRDCVSKLMSVAIAKCVENSVKNQRLNQCDLVDLDELKSDFETIISKYSPEKLTPTKFRKGPCKKYYFKDDLSKRLFAEKSF